MNEKYNNNRAFHLARLRRGLVRTAMQPIYNWQPLRSPKDGYTLVIGCPAMMTRVLFANLTLVQQQQCPSLREIIIAFDTTESHADRLLLNDLRNRFDQLPLRFIFYNRLQARVLNTIGWAWCYCWLNWVLPIGEVRTRYAIVHDLDALLLRDRIFEQRYHAIRERGDHYLGVNYYHGNGLTTDDRFAVTFEMAFDVLNLRQHTHPIDLFNCVTRHEGRRVEFDTFLYPQRGRRRSLMSMAGEDMVHPTQLVCQYVELHQRRRYMPPERNNLPMLAYFSYLAGDAEALETQRLAFDNARTTVVPMFGRLADCSQLSPRHVDWLVTQIQRVEQGVANHVREPVRLYLDSLQRFVSRRDQTYTPTPPIADTPPDPATTFPQAVRMSDQGRSE